MCPARQHLPCQLPWVMATLKGNVPPLLPVTPMSGKFVTNTSCHLIGKKSIYLIHQLYTDNDYGITMIGTCTQAGVPIKLHCHMIPTTTRTVTINSELYKQAAIFIVELKKLTLI